MSQAAPNIAVIDYGMGNLHSVGKALERVSPTAKISVSADAATIAAADRVVFPGVGAIRDCMAEIQRLGLDAVVADAIRQKPVLAICVGMQALMQTSEENDGVDCLGLLPGRVKLFSSKQPDGGVLKVPHMGWNRVEQTTQHPLWANIEQASRFYFVHSFYVDAGDHSQVAGACNYGLPVAAAIADENLFAVQFHPEKSATAGLQLLQNFVGWNI
jgi:glutamine amidotransferase